MPKTQVSSTLKTPSSRFLSSRTQGDGQEYWQASSFTLVPVYWLFSPHELVVSFPQRLSYVHLERFNLLLKNRKLQPVQLDLRVQRGRIWEMHCWRGDSASCYWRVILNMFNDNVVLTSPWTANSSESEIMLLLYMWKAIDIRLLVIVFSPLEDNQECCKNTSQRRWGKVEITNAFLCWTVSSNAAKPSEGGCLQHSKYLPVFLSKFKSSEVSKLFSRS